MSPYRCALAFLLAAGAGSSWAATVPTCSGAEIFSNEVVRYGRWEFRMLAAAQPGTVSSFFTYYNESYLTKDGEPWREIDIEVLGNKPEGFQSNLITLVPPDTVKVQSETFHYTDDVSAEYHTYMLDWTPDSVVWRMDGKLIRKVTTATSKGGKQISILRDKDQSYRMNLWASDQDGWVGAFDLGTLPIYQVVNWMTYSAYTPGAGPRGSNFTESWVDDFATFDTDRWSTANYGFETNLALFTPKNVKAVDGYLVLALTAKGQEGVKGTFLKDPQGNTRPSTGVRASNRVLSNGLTVRSSATGLQLSRTGLLGSENIRVLDASGRMLAQGSFAAGQASAEVPTLHTGLLLVRSGDRTVPFIR